MDNLDTRKRIHAQTFTLAEIMGFIAALAFACTWPVLLLPVVSIAISFFLIRSGLRLIEILVIVFITGLMAGILIPAVPGH